MTADSAVANLKESKGEVMKFGVLLIGSRPVLPALFMMAAALGPQAEGPRYASGSSTLYLDNLTIYRW